MSVRSQLRLAPSAVCGFPEHSVWPAAARLSGARRFPFARTKPTAFWEHLCSMLWPRRADFARFGRPMPVGLASHPARPVRWRRASQIPLGLGPQRAGPDL